MLKKLNMADLHRVDVTRFRQQDKFPITVVLDNVRSGLNVGSVFRTADAFAIDSLVLCGITQQPPHREILKTALGSTESVSWRYASSTVEAIRQLKMEKWQVWAVEQAQPKIWLHDFSFHSPDARIALVFGNEVEGVSEAALSECEGCIEVPQFGTKHSLNIAVSVGIVLWEAIRRFTRS